jgi:hypothetical protein
MRYLGPVQSDPPADLVRTYTAWIEGAPYLGDRRHPHHLAATVRPGGRLLVSEYGADAAHGTETCYGVTVPATAR